MNEIFGIQNAQYAFPYHHLPRIDDRGRVSVMRYISWGLEYLCYLEHIRGMVRGWRPQSLLDVGCGDGAFLAGLRGHCPRMVGVDLSADAIDVARSMVRGVEFRCQAAAAVDEQFDVVTSIEVLEHVPDDQLASTIASIGDRVKPGGSLVISVPTTVLELNRKHHRHYTQQLLETHMAAGAPDLEPVGYQHVYRQTTLLTLYQKATFNRWWILEVPALQQIVWRRIWTKHRLAAPGSGRHLVGVFHKPAR